MGQCGSTRYSETDKRTRLDGYYHSHTMVHYNVQFGILSGLDEAAGLAVIHAFLNELREADGIARSNW